MRMIVNLKKTKNTFQASHLFNCRKTTTAAERQIFTHLTMPMRELEVRTNFRSVHRPSVIQVTYGKNVRCATEKSVNNLYWKNQSRWFGHFNLFLQFPISFLQFCVNWFQQIQAGIIKSLPLWDSSSLVQFILLNEKFLQFHWLRAWYFSYSKYPHMKITNLLRVVV